MLTYALQEQMNKTNDWVSTKNKLGDLLHGVPNCVKGNWKFSRDGGATGDHYLLASDQVSRVVIPSGAIIINAFVYVKTAVTSGGLLTLDVNAEGANDTLAAAAVATLTLGASLQGIPDFATVADYVVTTAERNPTISFNVDTATAGELDVYFFYVF